MAEVGVFRMQNRLVRFLREELGISDAALQLALRRTQHTPSQLPMSLWQYGLISLGQLEQIFDWLETA